MATRNMGGLSSMYVYGQNSLKRYLYSVCLWEHVLAVRQEVSRAYDV